MLESVNDEWFHQSDVTSPICSKEIFCSCVEILTAKSKICFVFKQRKSTRAIISGIVVPESVGSKCTDIRSGVVTAVDTAYLLIANHSCHFLHLLLEDGLVNTSNSPYVKVHNHVMGGREAGAEGSFNTDVGSKGLKKVG